MSEIRNARIEGTMLGLEDHGIFTAYVYLDYGGAGQGFGGHFLKGEYAYLFVSRVLEVVGVSKWESLPGKPVRADADHGSVYGLGHLLNDEWFYPKKEWATDDEAGLA